MKNTLKRMFPLLLFTVALLLFTSCQDDFEENHRMNEVSNKESTMRMLTGKEALKKKQDLVTKLKENDNKGFARIANSISTSAEYRTKLEDIEHLIDYKEVLELKDSISGKRQFTYRLDHPDASETKFYNVVMREWNGFTRVSMITYDMERTFAENYYEDGDLRRMSGYITFEIISSESSDPCDPDNLNPPSNPGSGPGGGSNGAGSTWGGSLNDGVVMPPGQHPDAHQNLVAIKFALLSYIADTAPDLVSKSPRYFRMAAGLDTGTDPNEPGPVIDPCNEEIVGILDPATERDEKRRCEELDNLVSNEDIKDSFEDLESNTPDYREYGYLFSDDNNEHLQELELANGSDEMLHVPTGGLIYGASHTHISQVPQGNNIDKRAAPMFSLSDIIILGKIAYEYSPPQNKDLNKCVFTLTIDNFGEKKTFALKIEKWWEFREYLLQYNAMTNSQKKTKANVLNKRYVDTYNNGGGITNYIKDFFKFMEGQGLGGVALYEAEPDLSGWNRLTYNKNTNNIISTPCNN